MGFWIELWYKHPCMLITECTDLALHLILHGKVFVNCIEKKLCSIYVQAYPIDSYYSWKQNRVLEYDQKQKPNTALSIF